MIAAAVIYLIAHNYPMSGLILPVYYALLFFIYGVLIFILGELNGEDYAVLRGILGKESRLKTEVAVE